MRGQEFISSTPKFLSLYEALGETPPVFATLPPILGDAGTKKLSKRDGAKDILEYREEGYLPEAMCNFLAFLGWNPGGEKEIYTRNELIASFSLERIQRSGAQFNEDKLLFMNREHMRTLSDEAFIERGLLVAPDSEKLRKAVPLLRERTHTFGEAREMLKGELSCMWEAPTPQKDLLVAKEPAERANLTKQALESILGALEAAPDTLSADEAKALLMPIADAEEEKGKGGRGGVLWPTRYALSGLEKSPDPFTLISILGVPESSSRLRSALAIL